MLPNNTNHGQPQTISRREIINAVLKLNRAGCEWRLLLHEFPKWQTVYTAFRRWPNDGIWERSHDALLKKDRKSVEKKPTPTAVVIDSRSV
jgi:transposase